MHYAVWSSEANYKLKTVIFTGNLWLGKKQKTFIHYKLSCRVNSLSRPMSILVSRICTVSYFLQTINLLTKTNRSYWLNIDDTLRRYSTSWCGQSDRASSSLLRQQASTDDDKIPGFQPPADVTTPKNVLSYDRCRAHLPCWPQSHSGREQSKNIAGSFSFNNWWANHKSFRRKILILGSCLKCDLKFLTIRWAHISVDQATQSYRPHHKVRFNTVTDCQISVS